MAIWDAIESYQEQRTRASRSDSDQVEKPIGGRGITRSDSERVIKKASKMVGSSTDTLSKAKQVVDSNNQRLIEEMDREEGRLMEKSDTFEAQILRAMIKSKDNIIKGVLPVMTITECLNDGRKENYQFTPQRIGRRLSAMGFKKARTGGGASAIIWNEGMVDRMKGTYGLKETSETPEISEIPEETVCFRS